MNCKDAAFETFNCSVFWETDCCYYGQDFSIFLLKLWD